MQQIETMFRKEVDVIVSPATSSIAPKIQKDVLAFGESDFEQTARLMNYIIHGNITGIPAIVFPCGYDDDNAHFFADPGSSFERGLVIQDCKSVRVIVSKWMAQTANLCRHFGSCT